MEAGPPMPADGTALTSYPTRAGETITGRSGNRRSYPHPRPKPTTPEKGGAEHSIELFDTL